MNFFENLVQFLIEAQTPDTAPVAQDSIGRPDFQDNVGGPMAQNLRAGRIGGDPAVRRSPSPAPISGESLYDRQRAESIINQLIEQGVEPESAVAIAASQVQSSRGGTTIYNPDSQGVFGNLGIRFDTGTQLRDFAARVGGDVNDLSTLISYAQNEASIAELAGYEYTSGQPGPASQALQGIHSEFGQFLLNRPNDRTARIADQMMRDFFGPQDEQPAQDAGMRPETRPEMRPETATTTPTVPPVSGGVGDGATAAAGDSAAPVPAGGSPLPPPGQTQAPETSIRPIERPGEAAAFQTPITVLDDQGNAMSFNSLSRTEQRDYLLNNPQGAAAVTQQAAPEVPTDVDLSQTRVTGESRSAGDVTVAGGSQTGADRRAQGFLDRMFNQGSDLDDELARVRRRNFFRVFAESLNYLTTGSANLGPVYAAADRAEADVRERMEGQQQQAVLAEMATNMGMGELVGLMALGDEGVSAVRRAVIGAVVNGATAGSGGGGGGGGGGGSAEEEVDPVAVQSGIELFGELTGDDGTAAAASAEALGVERSAPAAPTVPSGGDFDGGYQNVDDMVQFSSFGGEAAPPQAAPVEVASRSSKGPEQPEITYTQAPAAAPVPQATTDMGTPDLGFDPDTIGRQFDEPSLPGNVPGASAPAQPFNYALDVVDGTPQEAEVNTLVGMREEFLRAGGDPDDPYIYQLNENITSALTDANEWRVTRSDEAAERARTEETDRERRQRMINNVATSFFRSPDIRAAAMNLAMSGTEEAERDLMGLITEEAQYNPASRGPMDTIAAFDTALENYTENAGPRLELQSIADTQLEFLVNPETSLNRLRTNLAVPIVEWVDPIAQELGIDLSGFANPMERAAAAVLNAQTIRAVAPTSSELPGAISNVEFLAFQEPARVADQPRLTALITNQVMRRNIEREELAQRARREYISTTPYQEQTPEDMSAFVAAQVGELEVMRTMPIEQLLAVREAGVSDMPPERLGEVVRVQYPDIDEDGNLVTRTEYTTIGQFDDINEDWMASLLGDSE